MTKVYIVSACRSAIGTYGGSLKEIPAAELGATVATAAMSRAKVEPALIDEVFFGCVLHTGIGQNIARQVALKAGVPATATATSINMVCGSGMKTIVEAARAIMAGDAEVLLVGGAENMSATPYAVPTQRWGSRMGNAELVDLMVYDGLTDVFNNYHMGITAENVAEQFGVTRERMDEFALRSQERASAAIAEGRFSEEIIPVTIKVKREEVVFDTDEHPRSTSAQALAKLRPAFKPDGRVTAGNSSGINDGAAGLVVASEEAVKAHGFKPIAELIGWGEAGVDPSIMGIGPVNASRKALARAGLTIDEIDLVEANEAFSAQAVAVGDLLGLDPERTNVNGGAIALGHPIGASGARIVVTLLHEMAKRNSDTGLATLCVGGGMGVATVFRRC